MLPLASTIAVVTGASRGAGRGIAVALGDAGATVYVVGRTRRGGQPPVDGAPGTIDDTADEVTRRGGRGIAIGADLTDDDQVAAVFRTVGEAHGRVDVVANAVWGGNERYASVDWTTPFWEQPLDAWRSTMIAGAYAFFLTARRAAPLLANRGVLVTVVDGLAHDGSRPYLGNMGWDLAHATIERMTVGMSRDLGARGVAVLAVMPGFMRTERVQMHLTTDEQRAAAGYDRTETPEYLGRVVAALAGDPRVIERNGAVTFVADLARAYGVTDVDGRVPPRFVIPT